MLNKVWIFVLVLFLSFRMVGITFALDESVGFNDDEQSLNNNLTVTTLDFSLHEIDNTPLSSPLFNVLSFKPGDTASESARIKKDGDLDFQYNLSAVKTSGDDNLCNALQIEARLDGVSKYSGNLMGLGLVPPVTITSGEDDWTFILTLASSDASLQDKSCNFNIVYKGWQTDSDGSWGFTDEELVGNSVTSGYWGAASSGDVVINEVMWMGSTSSTADEWIELRNMTDRDIDISNWRVDNAVSGGGGHLEIPANYTISAHGYFLIANYNTDDSHSALNVQADLKATNLSLNNNYDDNGTLILKDKAQNMIDSTPTPVSDDWPAGINSGGLRQSMERNDTPGDGTQVASWHTCLDSGCRSTAFWDSEGNNYGTPKAANLSSNDPTTPRGGPESIPAVFPPSLEATASASISIQPDPVATPSATIQTPPETLQDTPSPLPEATATLLPSTTLTPTPSSEQPLSEPAPTQEPLPVSSNIAVPTST